MSESMTGLPKRRSDGFTLMEIVISLGLIAVTLLAVFRLQAQNLDLQSEARFITIATHLAQDRISRLQANPALETGNESGDFGEEFPHFTYRQEVSEAEDMENVLRVEVVILRGEDGLQKEFPVETYLHKEAW